MAITEPNGKMFAFTYPAAPALSSTFAVATLFFFFTTWGLAKLGTSDNAAFSAFACGLLFVFSLLFWLMFRENGKIQRVIQKELPKTAIMLN